MTKLVFWSSLPLPPPLFLFFYLFLLCPLSCCGKPYLIGTVEHHIIILPFRKDGVGGARDETEQIGLLVMKNIAPTPPASTHI